MLLKELIFYFWRRSYKNNVFENLLRLKVPTSEEEQNALWDATQNLDIADEENNDRKALQFFLTQNIMQIGLIFRWYWS